MHWIPRLGFAAFVFYPAIEAITRWLTRLVVSATGGGRVVADAEVPIAFMALVVALSLQSWCRSRWGTFYDVRAHGKSRFVRFVLDMPNNGMWWFVGLMLMFVVALNFALMFLISIKAIDISCVGANGASSWRLPCTFDPQLSKSLLAGLILAAPWATPAKRASAERAEARSPTENHDHETAGMKSLT